MVPHSGILAWKIPLAEERDGPESGGHKESDKTEQLSVGLSCAFTLFAVLQASVQYTSVTPSSCDSKQPTISWGADRHAEN